MKSILKLAFAAILLAAGTVALAGGEPAAGTWNLDVAKSTFMPGPAPKSETRTYKETPQGTELTWKSVGADGKVINVQATIHYDGKDHPVTGSPNFDTLNATMVDSHTVKSVQKKGGKEIGHSTRVVSADGKTLTLTSKGTGADGHPYDNVQVYNKQ
jgi:hypothetical protein